jgi:glycosyltransferase involved in cell wall biosynthesis
MRLLLITAVYPTPRRLHKGAFNRELVAGLRLAGDEVRVVAPIPWPDLVRAPAAGPLPDGVSYPIWWYPSKLARVTHHTWMQWSVMPTVRRMTAKWRPDLVMGYWTHPDGTTALAAARELGVPGVVLAGGTDVLLLTSEPRRRRVIVDTLLQADQVLTVGANLRRKVIELGVPAERVAVFHHGVDRTRFHPGDQRFARQQLSLPLDRTIFLWVGHMVPVKGLDVLLAAWPRVASIDKPPLLLLIGDGDLRPALERQAANFGGEIRFLGALPHETLPAWYRAADMVLLPSRSEGVPNVLLESLACGTPFIASDVGDVGVLRDSASVTVPAGDAETLAAAIIARSNQPIMPVPSQEQVLDRAEAIIEMQAHLRAVLERRAPG